MVINYLTNCSSTLRCLISGEGGGKGGRGEGRGGGVKIKRGLEIFTKFNKRAGQINGGVGISKNPLISVINEKRDINV